jgi:ABC-type transporter Mla MlaB component
MAASPRSIVFAIAGPVDRADLVDLCTHMGRLLERSAADLVICDVRAAEPDAVTVDALGRVQLAARRAGCRLRLRSASRELRGLVALMGLDDALPAEEDVTPKVSAGGRTAGRAFPWREKT